MSKEKKDRVLRKDQAAYILNTGPKTVERLINEGHFSCCRVRGSIRIWESSVWDYLRRQTELFDLQRGISEETKTNRDNPDQDFLTRELNSPKIGGK